MEMEEGDPEFDSRACAILEAAHSAGECDEDALLALHELFGSFQRPGGPRGHASPSLWELLASRSLPLASVSKALACAMDGGGRSAILAADSYLGMLLSPGCPLYSLFTHLAFHSLVRCIRSCCRRLASRNSAEKPPRKKSQQPPNAHKRGRGPKRKSVVSNNDGIEGEVSPVIADGTPPPSANTAAASSHEVALVLKHLHSSLQVVRLKEHQESLKVLLELLVELPHLLSDVQEEEEEDGGSYIHRSSTRSRRIPPTTKVAPPSLSALDLPFSVMRDMLDPAHGQPSETAVVLFKLLAPGILLTQVGGSMHQRTQIRNRALQFVTDDVPSIGNPSLRAVMAALPRYLSLKAPEKMDGRANAVEAVMAVVKALSPKDQHSFAHFVTKLARGKPRQRLFAVDIAVSLLGGLANPLGIDRQEQSPCENDNRLAGEENGQAECLQLLMEENGDTAEEERERQEVGTSSSPPPPPRSNANVWWGVACLEALLQRCSDKVPAIRARALGNLAQTLEILSSDIRNRAVLQHLLGLGVAPTAPNMCHDNKGRAFAEGDSSPSVVALQTPGLEGVSLGGFTPSPEPSTDGPGASPLTPGPGHGDLGSLLRKRCLDEKVAVRKATLVLMMKSTSLLGKPPEDSMLQAIGSACADPMVSIRKTALAVLSEVLRNFPGDRRVVSEWLQSALPLVMDDQTGIQDDCLSVFQELVLDRIASIATLRLPGCHSNRTFRTSLNDRNNSDPRGKRDLDRMLPPGVLLVLKGIADDSSAASYVKRICGILGKRKQIRADVAGALQNVIEASKTIWPHGTTSSALAKDWTAPPGTWLLLSEVSAFAPKAVDWGFLRYHWQFLEKHDVPVVRDDHTPLQQQGPSDKDNESLQSLAWASDRVHLLQTISNIAVESPAEEAADLAAELLERLEGFDMHPSEVGAHVKALTTLCNRKVSDPEEGDRLVKVWVEELLKKAESILQSFVTQCSKGGNPQFETPRQTRSGRKQFTGNNHLSQESQGSSSPDEGISTSKLITTIFTVGALVLICPTAKLGHLVILLQTLVTAKDRGSKSFPGKNQTVLYEQIPPAVYAQSWITLGKMCLANHDLATRCIPLFVKELERADSPAVRNNIMVTMTDFCVKYTALVDGYIHKLTKPLRDPCELVRRQTFVLLARLLQRDYVKWRGTLFHRFLLALVDESDKICSMANFLFRSILKAKAPLLAYNSFVEAIFVLNDCHTHAGHSNKTFQDSESDRKLFSLRGRGESASTKRMHIYKCLLKQLAPEHLLATSAKLCAEILAAAADGLLDLKDLTAQCVVEDALKILASKEMRLSNHPGLSSADNVDMDEEGNAAVFAAAKGRVVTQLAKKNLVQNAIPIFIELKRLLESRNSPLIGMLMECMRVMLKEYKSEIEEILVADKQLQKEIMYDIQKYEISKARAKVAAAVTVAVSSSGAAQEPRVADMAPKNNNANQEDPSNVRTPVASSLAQEKMQSKLRQNVGIVLQNTPDQALESRARKTAMTVEVQNGEGLTPLEQRKGKKVLDASNIPTGGKENGGDGSFGKSARTKRKTLASPLKWAERTPGVQQGTIAAVRQHITTPKTNGNPRIANKDGGRPLIASSSRYPHEHNIASAVADIAAAATAAAVLREVAAGSSTPLQSMSIPRLHPSVPSTVKKAGFLSKEKSTAALPGFSKLDAIEELDSIRRRQSFSLMDEPPV